MYMEFRGKRYHHRHFLSDYLLFRRRHHAQNQQAERASGFNPLSLLLSRRRPSSGKQKRAAAFFRRNPLLLGQAFVPAAYRLRPCCLRLRRWRWAFGVLATGFGVFAAGLVAGVVHPPLSDTPDRTA